MDPVLALDLTVGQEVEWQGVWYRITETPYNQGSDIIAVRGVSVDDPLVVLDLGVDVSITFTVR
jgi:hypothetical protein